MSLTGPAVPRLYAGVPFALAAALTDADADVTALSLAWTSSRPTDDLSTLATTASADGSLTTTATLDAGTVDLTLTATDADGLSATDALSLEILPTNTAPGCSITAPTAGTVDPTLDLSGTASDAEQPADTLTATWSSDVDGTLGTATPDGAGALSLPAVTLSGGTHLLTLTVADELGLVCTTSVAVLAGRPPELSNALPVDDDLVLLGSPIRFSVVATDPDEPATALSVAWSSDVDGSWGSAVPDVSGAAFVEAYPSRTTHTWTVTVTDSTGLTASATATLFLDGPPDAPTVEIQPSAPTTTDGLVATVTASETDPDGDPVSTTVLWTSPGQPSVSGTTLAAELTSRDQVWTATATSSDGFQTATAAASVTIGNTAPTVASVAVQPDPATILNALTCTPTGLDDLDGDSAVCAWSWTVDGLPNAAADSTLAAGDVPAHASVTCTCTPGDGTGNGAAVTSPVLTLANTPPSAPGAAVSPPEAPGDALHCTLASASTDADADALSYTVTWTVDGDEVVGSTDVLDGDTIPEGTTAAGEVWSCVITVDDGYGGVVASAPAEVTVPLDPDAIVARQAAYGRIYSQRADGTWTCTGHNGDHTCEGPRSTPLQVRASERAACGRGAAGTIGCWGSKGGPGGLVTTDSWDVSIEGGCAISAADGRVVCWGGEQPSQPFPTRSYTRIAVGVGYVCGLDSPVGGTPNECLASSLLLDAMETEVPAATSGRLYYSATSAACSHRPGSTITCWGNGALDDDAPFGNYASMDARGYNACGIRTTDGGLTCWGEDVDDASWKAPTGAWTAVSMGHTFGVATDAEGATSVFGSPRFLVDLPLDATVAELSMHESGTACLVDDAGKARCTPHRIGGSATPLGTRHGVTMGRTTSGGPDTQWACWQATPNGSLSCQGGSSVPSFGSPVQDWDTGPSFVCGVDTTEALACAGASSTILTAKPAGTGFTRIACSLASCCAVDTTNGSLRCWGPSNGNFFRVPSGANDYVDVAASDAHYCGQHADGTWTCWAGISTNPPVTSPVEPLVDVALGYDHNGCGLTATGELTCWGVDAEDWAHGAANGPYDRVWSDGFRSWCGRRSSDHTLACWGEWYR